MYSIVIDRVIFEIAFVGVNIARFALEGYYIVYEFIGDKARVSAEVFLGFFLFEGDFDWLKQNKLIINKFFTLFKLKKLLYRYLPFAYDILHTPQFFSLAALSCVCPSIFCYKNHYRHYWKTICPPGRKDKLGDSFCSFLNKMSNKIGEEQSRISHSTFL